MTWTELIELARKDFLYDDDTPQKWSSTYLSILFSQAEREAAKRASLIRDTTTQVSTTVASGTATSTTANKLVDSGATFTSAVLGLTVYNSTDNTWATISAVDSGTTLSLSADIMASGESYVIGNPSNALTRICVQDGIAEYSLSQKVIKVDVCYLASKGRQYPLIQQPDVFSNVTGTPIYYTERKKKIRLAPIPDANLNSETGIDTLNLEIYRLPLLDCDLITEGASPEIDEEYHLDLIHWVCYMAFMKQDDQTIDPAKSQWHEQQFINKFGPALSYNEEIVLKELPSNFSLKRSSFGL